MNQITRICAYKGHQQFLVSHICTFKQCHLTRWCCSKCLSDGIHDHLMPEQNHIMNQARLSYKLKKDIEKLQRDFLNMQEGIYLENWLSRLMKEFYKLEQLVMAFQEYVESLMNNVIKTSDSQLQQLINQVEGKDFIQLDDDAINKLLNINQYQINVKLQLVDPLHKIEDQLKKFTQIVKDYQENKIDYCTKSRMYDIQRIYKGEYKYFSESTISNNKQYLVYHNDNNIRIQDIKLNKICKSIQQQNIIISFKFTSDSQYLFVGNTIGQIYGFFMQKDFKIFYKQQIHNTTIFQIIIIQKQYLLTCSDDKTIIKTDFIQKKQVFQLVGHTKFICCFDYDDLNDFIISASGDSFIKIWDCSNQSVLIDYKGKQKFQQVQFINNKQNILGFDTKSNLQILKIDYKNKLLLKLGQYDGIQGFQQVNNDQNLLLFYTNYCKLLNNQGERIQTIWYDCQIDSISNHLSQLDNLNYIILQDDNMNIIYLFKALN